MATHAERRFCAGTLATLAFMFAAAKCRADPASLDSSTVTFSDSPADYATLTWNSNLSSCNFSSTPSLLAVAPDNNSPFGTVPLPQGSLVVAGGGGAIGLLELALLAGMRSLRCRARIARPPSPR